MEARPSTYNQYSGLLSGLNLKPVMERLVGCAKGQPIARRLNEIERLRLMSAAELVDELILSVAALASRGSNVGDVVARLVKLAVRTDLDNSTRTVEANDMEVFGNVLIVVWSESAAGQ
jgi:ribosomal protein L17